MISQPEEKIQKMGRHAKKSLGQHFLKNERVLDEIISLLTPESGDFFIEIGPGNGELTLKLIQNLQNSDYIAIEKDGSLAEKLTEKTQGSASFFTIKKGDALDLLPEILEKSDKKAKVFGNIPYYITGKIFRILFEKREKIERAVFLIQQEVAERICEKKGGVSRLSAFVGVWGTPKIALYVGKNEFRPVPKVDSAVIVIQKNEPESLSKKLETTYEMVVRTIFSQPRKKAINNATELFSGTKTEKKEAAERFFSDANIPHDARPHTINISKLILLAEMLYNKSNEAQNT